MSTGPSGHQSLAWSGTGEVSPLAGEWYKEPHSRKCSPVFLTHRILCSRVGGVGQPCWGGRGCTLTVLTSPTCTWLVRHSSQKAKLIRGPRRAPRRSTGVLAQRTLVCSRQPGSSGRTCEHMGGPCSSFYKPEPRGPGAGAFLGRAGQKRASDEQTFSAELPGPYKQDPQREDSWKYEGKQFLNTLIPEKRLNVPSFFF